MNPYELYQDRSIKVIEIQCTNEFVYEASTITIPHENTNQSKVLS